VKNWFGILLLAYAASSMTVAGASVNENSETPAKQLSYVQSKLAVMYAQPKFSAKKIRKLELGIAVEVLEREKSWVKIRFQDSQGWVANMVLDSNKPLPATRVDASEQPKPKRKARKRASVRASAAATRGLSGMFRKRHEDAQQDSNFEALQEIEAMKVEEKDVLEFNQALQQ